MSAADTSTPARSRISQDTGTPSVDCCGCRHRPPNSTVHRGLRVPMRDGVELIADHYVPAIDDAKGTLLVRGPYGRGWPISGLFGAVYAARGYHVLVQSVRGTFGSGGDFTPIDQRSGRRRRHGGVAARAALVHRLVRHRRAVLPGLHPVGAADRSAARDEGGGDRRRPARPQRTTSWGTGSFSLNDFLGWSDLVAHQEDPGQAARSRPAAAGAAGGGQSGERVATGRGRPGTARRRRAVVRILARTSRPERPVLGRAPVHRSARPRADPGAADQRLAGPVSATDAGAVPAPAPPRSPSRIDGRAVDPHPHDDQGRPDRDPGIAGLARHPPGRQRHGRRAARCGSTSTATAGSTCPTGHPRCPSRCCTCSRRAGSPTPSRPPRRRRRCSPTTPPIRRPRSVVDCCHRTAATATTPGWPSVPTCSASPATRFRRTCTSSAPR